MIALLNRYNLEAPTNYLANFFNRHPTLYKMALVVNHLFRAAMMVGLMFVPGIPQFPCMAVCFAGSLFYRLTVEKNCAYKFALPAFAGAAAFMLALPSIISMINGAAFVTAATCIISCASLIPLALYAAYILLTVSYDVDMTLAQLPDKKDCCKFDKIYSG